MQPIIRGVQNVGQVELRYRYLSPDGKLLLPTTLIQLTAAKKKLESIATSEGSGQTTTGILVAGFRLDSEFIRANPQIASSIVIPLLGGGGIALTNNNRTGTLRLRCTKVSVPDTTEKSNWSIASGANSQAGVISESGSTKYYDLVTLAQIQQSQSGGDSYGAELSISFQFASVVTKLTFEMCTVQTVDPLGLAGNDAADYDVVFNYLNWKLEQKAA
jgi:hypothetical protein